MSEAYGATVAKRRLAYRLLQLRREAGFTANQVCDRLNWGRGKVGRFEGNEWVRPQASDVRDLARIYGQVDGELAELEELVRVARQRAWWREYMPDVFTNEFPGYENDASAIDVIMPLVLPGLLQTEAYTRALLAVGARPAEWQERALRARMRRQQILDRDDGTAPRLTALITEASLMFRWGTQADRRAQIAHLAEMSTRPNIEIRLLRAADGFFPGMATLVNIFRFPGELDPPMLFLENDAAIQQVDAPEDVEAYAQIFAQVRQATLDPATTTDHLRTLSTTLE